MNADCFTKCEAYFDDPTTNPRVASTGIYTRLTSEDYWNPKITWDYNPE